MVAAPDARAYREVQVAEGAPIPPMMMPPGALPAAASPTSATPPEGLRAQARKKLGECVAGLIDALAILKEDANSDEGKRIVQALKILGPVAPESQTGPDPRLAALMGGGGRPMPPPGMLGTPQPRPLSVLSGPGLPGA